MPKFEDIIGVASMGGLFVSLILIIVALRHVKSKNRIWFYSLLAAFGAISANAYVDGQGACFLILFSPMIYAFAVVGRNDFDDVPQKLLRRVE